MTIYPVILLGSLPGFFMALAFAPSAMWDAIFAAAFVLGQGVSAALCWKYEI